jgi:uncharacterized protein (DUF58 family)
VTTDKPALRRRLTPLGIRFTVYGLVAAGFSTMLGSRTLLAVSLGLALLPLLSFGWLPAPGGRTFLRLPTHLQAGVPAAVRVETTRRSDRAAGPMSIVVLVEGWPGCAAWVEPQAAGTRVIADFTVVPPARGVVQRALVHMVSRDPLGLAEVRWSWSPRPEMLRRVVHPAAVGAPRLPSPATAPIPEFAGLRTWQAGDRPRDVDWRATARRPSTAPVVRLWSEQHSSGGELILGVGGGGDAAACERVAEVAAAVVRRAFATYDRVTLRWDGGEISGHHGEPLLDALAQVPVPGAGAPAATDLLIAPAAAAGAPAAGRIWRVDSRGLVAAA